MKTKTAVVLLVEDSPADQVIVQRALEDGRVKCRLLIVDNGLEALKLLRGEAPYENRDQYPSPDLILLDVNMPIMDGKETLRTIRQDDALSYLPVVILTTSSREKDVIESYRLGVNAYLTKPVDESAFMNTIIQIERFWFELVTLPTQTGD